MLVLSRMQGERVHIGEHIVVTVIGTRNGRVRLGFEAPEDVAILRDEVLSDSRQGSRPEVKTGGKYEGRKQRRGAGTCQ